MTIRSLLKNSSKKISEQDARWLLSFYLDCGLAELDVRSEEELSKEILSAFNSALEERVTGKPLQYIVSCSDFYGLNLYVDEHVLIPRPETEELVELVLTDLGSDEDARILDIGTGSGAIGLAIKNERPNWWVGASDISHRALAVAERNSRDLNLPISYREGFLLEPWTESLEGAVIVANLPYVDKDDPSLAPDVKKYEPMLALVPQSKRASTLKLQAAWLADELLMQIKEFENSVRSFYLELSKPVITALLNKWSQEEFPYELVSKKDLRGNLRFLIGKKKS